MAPARCRCRLAMVVRTPSQRSPILAKSASTSKCATRGDRSSISQRMPLVPWSDKTVASGGMRAFYRIWTLREAYAKACGAGFSILVDGRDYFPDAPDAGVWQKAIDGRQRLFSTGDLPEDHAVAVAIELQSPREADCA